ncbi:MAG: hypothetical protein RLY97_1551 [Pseudomonadota bacterium]|jgi:glutathione S-transferase
MTLKYYHAEPAANSLKSMIALKEKGLDFESIYIDLHKFEQHSEWFVKLNPEGQVPVLEHDGVLITHTTVINEYLEDAFPDAPPLRPADPVGKAQMRYWNKFIDEHVMNYVSMHGWHRMIGVIARNIDSGEFEQLLERIPLHEQREKWKTARSGFSESDLENATRKIEVALIKVEKTLGESQWIAGDSFTTADANFYAMCGMMVHRMFPEMDVDGRFPRHGDWRARMESRPGVRAALEMPDHTAPGLRTFTGHVR